MYKNILQLKKYSDLTFMKIIIIFFALFVSNFLDIFGIIFFIPIIDTLNNNNSNITIIMNSFINDLGFDTSIKMYLVIMVIAFLLKGVISFLTRYYIVEASSKINYNLRAKIYGTLIDTKLNFLNEYKKGTLLSLINEHTIQVGRSFFIFINIIIALSTVIMYLIFIVFISLELTLVTILMALLLYPIIKWLGKKAYFHTKRYVNSLEELQHYSLETFQSKKLINSMKWKRYMLNSFSRKSETLRENWKWNAFYANSPTIVIQPYSMIMLAFIMWGAIEFNLSLGLLGTFALAFMRLLPSLQQAGAFTTDLKAAEPSIQKVLNLLEHASKNLEEFGNKKVKRIDKSIKLNNITFGYNSEQNILSNLSLNIEKNKTIALVGPSGGGKTTVVDLILGLQSPNIGQITIDDIDLTDIDLKSFRKSISYVSQDTIFFNDTIYHNLIIGLERKVERSEVMQLCKDVGVWDFILSREKNLDENIGDSGVKLSGGQRQKLNLVRALLRNPNLLILDEATSALDNKSENDIRDVMIKLNHKTTIIVIAHRFETIKHADKIYYIHDKKAEDLGVWEEASKILLNSNIDLKDKATDEKK